MPGVLSDSEWNNLLKRIADGKCTPFLGAGACYGALPLGAEIAREWAAKFNYPLADKDDLIRVAQFVAVQQDPMAPKEEILRRFQGLAAPNFKEADEPHGVLAELPLPVYMTTNYDDFMFKALERQRKDARRETCRWNRYINHQPSALEGDTGAKPTVANPVVFHLHGHSTPESLVLTEDDYLQFLATISREPDLLPRPIKTALAESALLFIGYRLADWNFRVLLQGLRPTSLRRSIVVMTPPGGPDAERQKAQEYLDKYYAAMELRVYWGPAREFCGELRRRWTEYAKTL